MKLHINLPATWFCVLLLFLVLEGSANKIEEPSRKLTDIIKKQFVVILLYLICLSFEHLRLNQRPPKKGVNSV